MKNITSFAKYILLVIGIILVSSLANAQYPHVFATLPGGNVPASYLDDNFNAVPSNVVKYTPSGGTPTTAVSKLNQYVNLVDYLPASYVTDCSVDYHTQVQAAIVAARALKLPLGALGGCFSLGSVGVTITGSDSILGSGMFYTQFQYSGTGAAITATAWTGTLADFWIFETNSAASAIQAGGGSQKPTIRNLFAQISNAASSTASGSGLYLQATGDSAFSGGMLVQNVYFVGYKFGVNFRASSPGNSWTSVTMYDLWLVGRGAGVVSGSVGIYMDANTNGVGTMLMGGTIERFDYPIYANDGVFGGVFETDIEGCTYDNHIGNSFNGRIIDAAGNQLWKATNGSGGPIWNQYKTLSGIGPITESYYSPKYVLTSGNQQLIGNTAWQTFHNDSLIDGNPVGPYGLKFQVGVGQGSSVGIAVTPSDHFIQLSDVSVHWDSVSPSSQSGSQIVAWNAGSVAYNYTPSSGNPIGWMCTVSGANTTGNINSGSSALTVAVGTSILNGQAIRVVGAGVAGGDLSTTVSSGGGTTSIVLSATASTSVTGAAVYTPGTWKPMGNLP